MEYTPIEMEDIPMLNGGGSDDVNYAYQFKDETLWVAGEAIDQSEAGDDGDEWAM